MVPPEKYERMLHWFYDRSLEGGIELKATCAPHYFRVLRQRRAQERRAAGAYGRHAAVAGPASPAIPGTIGPTDMAMPGATGIVLNPSHAAPLPQAAGH